MDALFCLFAKNAKEEHQNAHSSVRQGKKKRVVGGLDSSSSGRLLQQYRPANMNVNITTPDDQGLRSDWFQHKKRGEKIGPSPQDHANPIQ